MPNDRYIPARERYKVDVPEGRAGDWAIERFTVSAVDAKWSYINVIKTGRGAVREGTYTRLAHRGCVIMSDTPDEIHDHLNFIRLATGRVLIHGLGLGMCLGAVAAKPEVTHVLVVEHSPEVIELAGPHYRARFGNKVEIRQGNAFTWKPEKGQHWNVVWHDIWPDLNEDNLTEMTTLHRRFGRRCDWQGSWGRELLRYRRSRG